MVATYAITNSRRYALKQEIKPSDDVEDEETSLTLWHFILEFHSGGSWSLEVQDFKILLYWNNNKTVKLSTTRRRGRRLFWHFDTLFWSFIQGVLEVLKFRISRYSYIETIDKTVKLSTTRRRRGIHFTVIPPTKHAWRHIRNNCLSKAFLMRLRWTTPIRPSTYDI